MNDTADNLDSLIRTIQRKAPEYIDLLTATSEEEFFSALDAILEKAVTGLESNSKNFQELDEVGLTAVLTLAIRIPGLSVTQEANSNGHVDITISADHCVPSRTILGEAKNYDGPVYHIEGLQQLINRYATGRDSRGLLIVYFKNKGISGLITKLRERMDTDHPCQQQGATRSHTLQWSFLSTHTHSSGVNYEVAHVGCNLFYGDNSS